MVKWLFVLTFVFSLLHPSVAFCQSISEETAKQMLADIEAMKADYNKRKLDFEKDKDSFPEIIQQRRQQELDELLSRIKEQEAEVLKIIGQPIKETDNVSQETTDKFKAIEEGSLLPDNDFIQENIQILNICVTHPRKTSYRSWKILSLCKEDVFAFTEQWNMDKLDKALYMKSEKYQSDMEQLRKERDQLYAYMFDLDNDEYKNKKQFWVDFDTDGLTFRCYNVKNETHLKSSHICAHEIAFPVQPEVTDNGYDYNFKCNDLVTLKKIKDRLGHIVFVILFKPAFAQTVTTAGLATMDKNDVAFVNPVAMYILDKNNGEVVLDLSNYIREIASEHGYKSEIAFIEAVNKKEKAQQDKWEKDYKQRQANKKYHSTPKQETCWLCFGNGKIRGVNEMGAAGEGPWQRCTVCYGKGYTLEHYY